MNCELYDDGKCAGLQMFKKGEISALDDLISLYGSGTIILRKSEIQKNDYPNTECHHEGSFCGKPCEFLVWYRENIGKS